MEGFRKNTRSKCTRAVDDCRFLFSEDSSIIQRACHVSHVRSRYRSRGHGYRELLSRCDMQRCSSAPSTASNPLVPLLAKHRALTPNWPWSESCSCWLFAAQSCARPIPALPGLETKKQKYSAKGRRCASCGEDALCSASIPSSEGELSCPDQRILWWRVHV